MLTTETQTVEPNLKSWPVTVVALFFVLQGLTAGYYALAYVGMFGYSLWSAAAVGYATIYSISSVALIVAGAGLLARNRACLTLAVVLAGLNLLSAGADAAEAFLVPTATPLQGLTAIAFIAAGCLQYVILRSKSTIALFSKSS